MAIDNVFAQVETINKSWSELLRILLNSEYDVESPRGALNNDSLLTLSRRLEFISEVLLSLRPDDDSSVSWMVLNARSVELTNVLNVISTHIVSVLNIVNKYPEENLKINDGNNNFHIQIFSNGNNVLNQDLSGNFVQINNHVASLIHIVSSLLPLCKGDSVSDLSVRVDAMKEAVNQIENLRDDSQKTLDSINKIRASADSRNEEILRILEHAKSVDVDLQALLKGANEDSSSVTALVAQIKTTGANAQSLEEQIIAYEAKFKAFQKDMDARLKQFREFEESVKVSSKKNQDREAEIDRLTELSETMISGATTAGLATSLENTRKRYEDRMIGARRGFWFAVALLVVSALPLAAELVPGLLGTIFPVVHNANQDQSPYAVLGKIFLLLPATWLTAFFTKSYSQYFHLEREYSHKAALAQTVDGFKKQAPKYEEEITAEVFMEVRTNPASKDGPEPAGHPLYDVLNKVVKSVLNKEKGDS